MIDIKVPVVGESISEVTLLKWVKPDGAYVERDEVIAELESEKATFEVNAEKAGILKTLVSEGDTIAIGSVLATIDEKAAKPATTAVAAASANEKLEEKTVPAASKPVAEAKAAGKGKIEVKVPVVGESISEVTLLKWTKSNGDLVRRDEVIAELESEKATFELNAEEAGQLATSAKEGETIKIGSVIAVIDTDIAVPAEQQAVPQKPVVAEAKPATQAATSHSADVKATPVAAAIIADKKIDPKSITASGTAGRIVKGDVLAALGEPRQKSFRRAGIVYP